MVRLLEKTERRLGEKLFLKGDRCLGPKCATVRRAYPPGPHGKKGGRRRALSEYAILMREKQKVRYIYGLDDKEIRMYSKKAASKPGIFSSHFLQFLERRLDNTVFRLGIAESRRIARQAVGHGHITVNGKALNIPSYMVKKGDVVGLTERSLASPLYGTLDTRLKKRETPRWLQLDPEKKQGAVVRLPEEEDAALLADITKVKEFYSR